MTKVSIIFFLGLIIRLFLIPAPGFEADIAFWKSWSLAAEEKGINWLTQNTNYNYPSGFALILWLVGKIYRLFADPQNYNQYWNAHNFLYLFLIKLIPIFSDIFLALGIFLFFSQPEKINLPPKIKKLAPFLAGAYFFHPLVLYDGVWWGQVDSLGAVFLVWSLIFLFWQKPVLGAITLTAGFLLKMQLMIFLPLFFIILWIYWSWKTMIKGIIASFLTFLFLSFPFLLANNLGRTFTLITQNADWFPLLSLRADNFWWLYSWGKGMTTSDKILTLGIIQAKTLGLILFSAGYLLALFALLPKPTPQKILISFSLAGFSFFLFPTQSHERYLFPTLVLLLFLVPFYWEDKKKNIFITLLTTLSLASLINLNSAMKNNYPHNSWPFLDFTAKGEGDILVSFVNLGAFFWLLNFWRKEISRIGLISACFLILLGIIWGNLKFFLGKPISLSSLKPIDYSQDFGSPQFNLAVQSTFGPKSWSFLSVNWFFYRKGIGTHANSKISWDLGGRFSKFFTGYGVDSLANQSASVIFEIWGDDQLLFRSSKITRADLPQATEVSVKGVKTLTLVVNDAGDGIYSDHADWLEPRLYK
ncbi:MAG: NPCBM/NEW2 domain-containing protein [Microgenomates group bacterium]